MIDATIRVTGKDFPVSKEERRAGDPAELVASSDKIHETLGWEVKHSLDQCIESAYQWHLSHPNGYESS